MVDSISKVGLANFAPIADVKDAGATAANPTKDFSQLVSNALNNTMEAQKTAEMLSTAVASGQDVPIHQVTQAIAQAEATLQTLVAVRDRAVEAYQTISQMPI